MATPSFKFRYHQNVYPAIDPSRPDLSAAGKTVLITGGGKSIGKAITTSFAIAGAKNIIILGRELEALNTVRDELQNSHPKTAVYVYAADVADSQRCSEIFEEVKTKIAPIDVLVLNAAYLHTPDTFETMDFDDFWKGFEINVKANTKLVQFFCKACSSTPTLINVSSFLAWLGPIGYHAQGYAASKAAFDVLMMYLADQRKDMRVFTIHPGSIISDMLKKVGADPTREGVYDDGAVAVYLASPRADYLRGKTIESEWDVEDMEKQADVLTAKVQYPEMAPPAPLTVGLAGRSVFDEFAGNN